MAGAETEVNLVINTIDEPKDRFADTDPKRGANSRELKTKNGQFKAITVTFYKKSIETALTDNLERFNNASYEEALGTVATREPYHNDPDQIKLDKKQPKELKQNRAANKPINAEINFRLEYHKKNPGLPNAQTWHEKYVENKFKVPTHYIDKP